MAFNVVIFGGGAIGSALAGALLSAHEDVQLMVVYRRYQPNIAQDHRLRLYQLDALDEARYSALAQFIQAQYGTVHWVINAIGTLHDAALGYYPEKRLSDCRGDSFSQVINTNVLPSVYIGKYLTPLLDTQSDTVVAAISAKVGSIGDNHLGGWYSYRASKAALNMVLKTMAIELARKYQRLRVLALHPGTTQSSLSEPFQKNVAPGKLFTPEYTAQRLIEVINGTEPKDSGEFFAWDGTRLPW